MSCRRQPISSCGFGRILICRRREDEGLSHMGSSRVYKRRGPHGSRRRFAPPHHEGGDTPCISRCEVSPYYPEEAQAAVSKLLAPKLPDTDDLRGNGNFRRPVRAIGNFKALGRKYFAFVFSESVVCCLHPASSKRGVRVVTIRRGGLRWTCERRQTTGVRTDGEVVWSWRPGAGALRNAFTRCRRTGAREPV